MFSDPNNNKKKEIYALLGGIVDENTRYVVVPTTGPSQIVHRNKLMSSFWDIQSTIGIFSFGSVVSLSVSLFLILLFVKF